MAIGLAIHDSTRLRLAMAFEDYKTDRVRLARKDLSGFTHLVASRKGLYLVSPTKWAVLAYGSFFGLTLRGDDIYAFQACDLPHSPLRRGRIVRLERRGNVIMAARVISRGLDNGCHQMDFIDGRLCVVDTYNQQIVRFTPDGTGAETISPLPTPPAGRWSKEDLAYVHANSLLAVGDRILLLLHNHFEHTGRRSEIAIYDKQWKPLERWQLTGRSCHDLALLEDGTLLVCDSLRGDLISAQGMRVRVSPYMTRGLAVGADSIVIGASRLAKRGERMRSSGTVTFMDREHRVLAVLEIPGAPMALRRLDGQDASLSGYVQEAGWGRNLQPGYTVHATVA